VFRRRRPLLRGAAAGAAGYAVGKRMAGRHEEEQSNGEDAATREQTAMSGDDIKSLRKLAQLKEEGILTDEEFEAQKPKLLRS